MVATLGSNQKDPWGFKEKKELCILWDILSFIILKNIFFLVCVYLLIGVAGS